MKKKWIALLLTSALMLFSAAGAFAEEGDIVDVASSAGSFTTLVAAVQEAGLVDTLKGSGPFTVFAPTDEAFAALLAQLGATAEQLLARPDLADILLYHVVPGKVVSSDLREGLTAQTANGQALTFTLSPVQVNGVNIVAADVEASNGVIHVIDQVLLPPAAAEAEATEADQEEAGTIVDVASAAGSFQTLVAALVKTGLDEALQGKGPFTVFAPSDEAFSTLLAQLGVTADELLARDDLTDILLYHVIQGKVLSSDLSDGMEASTLNGKSVIISLNPAKVNDSAIVATDIEASNGVIHVIDQVLLPPSDEMPPIPKTGDTSAPLAAYWLLAGLAGLAIAAAIRYTRVRTHRG